MTKTEAKWAERVRRWRASGKTAEEFARPEDFRPSTLRYYASRLKDAAVATNQANGVQMVRVKRSLTATSGAPVLVVVGDARIEVRAGFDEAVLRQVVIALGGAQ